jgi:hypothetical protein
MTLPMGPGKVYVIRSPQLIHAAMRKKTLSLDPLTIAFAERMIGFGPKIMDLMNHPPTDGSIAWLHDQHKSYEPLAPGPALNDMNTRVLNTIAEIFNPIGTEFETKKFYLFIRDSFTIATTKALFGANNPLTNDPQLNDSIWYVLDNRILSTKYHTSDA